MLVSRRQLLIGGAAGLAGPLAALPAAARRRSLRVAHLTDCHVQPELGAPEGMIAALRHARALKPRPDLILLGGDQIMDAFATSADRARSQWSVLRRVLEETDIPVRQCIGNHDVTPFLPSGERMKPDARDYAKRWAVETMSLPGRHYGFDLRGWRFLVLDSTFVQAGNYTGRLDEEQFDWLQGELARTPAKTPVLLVSHIPILTITSFFDGNRLKDGVWQVPGSWMHVDAPRLKNLLLKHPNVKLALSGHMHQVDRVDFNGVSYLCNGAVCGAWWKGAYYECAPGYGVVDLYGDGSFENRYVEWGWKA